MKILVLAGSIRKESSSLRVSKALKNLLKDTKAEVIEFDFLTTPLPIFDDRGDEYNNQSAVSDFRKKVLEADALIVISPDYHSSMSGLLKNALDFIAHKECEQKVVGLVCVTSNGASGGVVLSHLRDIFRSMHAWVIPTQAVIERASEKIKDDGSISDPSTAERLEKLCREVLGGVGGR